MKASKRFTTEQKEIIKNAIVKAEKATSAEICVHIENHCKGLVLDRAVEVFRTLKMHETDARNGVLIYLAIDDRLASIIGDKAINEKVDSHFWSDCYQAMSDYFKQEKYTEGICTAIHLLEIELKSHFPHQPNDVNELSNEISFDA